MLLGMTAKDPFTHRRSAGALLGSVLVHGAFLALVLGGAVRLEAIGDASRHPGLAVATRGGGGGGGGVEMRFVAVAPASAAAFAAPAVVLPPPPPEPVAAEVVPAVAEPEAPVAIGPMADSVVVAGGGAGSGGIGPGAGGGTGGGVGTGRGTGTGGGSAPGDGGEAGRAMPPEPRQMIIPPDFPRSMRGVRVTVIFEVAADGRVRQVEFEPAVPDRAYARRLESVMREYRFRPARDETGREVPGVARVVLTF
jgi:outer membrane biosynthesis protein TonB